MNILFIDPKATETYDFKYLQDHSIGGTESTLLNVAQGLAKNHYVTIAQINRPTPKKELGINYVSISSLESQPDININVIIILRKYKLLPHYQSLFKQAKLFVWVHNFQNLDILGRRHRIVKTNATVICVSNAHKKHINRKLNGLTSWIFRLLMFKFTAIPITFIYNPIAPLKSIKPLPIDSNKLLFFSTPNKGLYQVIRHFKALIKTHENYVLYIAGADEKNLKDNKIDLSGINKRSIVILGKLNKTELNKHIQSAFCVFYPQNVFAETYGLIFAESNQLGTPVIAANLGASAEILSYPDQLVDCSKTTNIIKTLDDWSENGRPVVHLQNKLTLKQVIKDWNTLLSK